MSGIRAKREAVFVCTYTTRSGEANVWVRAWSVDQARELALAQLHDAGVRISGDVRVVPREPARQPDEQAEAATA